MGNLLTCISELPNVRCYQGYHEVKCDFYSFEYFHLLIPPNTPESEFSKSKPLRKTADMALIIIGNKFRKIPEAVHYG